jgi:hypothetical protein
MSLVSALTAIPSAILVKLNRARKRARARLRKGMVRRPRSDNDDPRAPLYSDLSGDSFRLLHFLDDTGLSCTMQTHSRLETPPYICLSYAWGRSPSENSPAYSMTLNDTPFSVQQNLYDALRHLGKHVRKRGQAFWVDAICINQKDKDERGVQVQQMKEIYERSTAVFAWLGVPYDDDKTRLAVILMRHFDDLKRDFKQKRKDGPHDDMSRLVSPTHMHFFSAPGSKVWPAWEGLDGMLSQEYWRRVWIFQEATTPGEILFFCGEHRLSESVLLATILFIHELERIPKFPARFRLRASGAATGVLHARAARRKKKKNSLIDLMQQMREAGCTDPRDRVYAPLGHAVDVPPDRIKPDYSKSVVELYTDVARYLLLESATGLAALGFVLAPTEKDSSNASLKPGTTMPSWIPDWRQGGRIRGISYRNCSRISSPLYNPAPGVSDLTVRNFELHVQGLVVDDVEIDLLTEICEGPNKSWKTPHSWYKQIMKQYPNLDEAVRRCVIADCSPAESTGCRRGGLVDWEEFERGDPLDMSSRETMIAIEPLILDSCCNSRMAVLNDNSVAILPPAAQKGDQIAAFIGGHVLYLLRQKEDTYTFVGECYVEGWMDGALVEGARHPVRTLRLV